MVERNTQIDLVLPFYNDSDKEWAKVLYNYMSKENSNDRQVTGEERYRDWENLKYWFRAVEKNCKWVNKVYLVVASESQIPKWINKDCEKLKIVLHKDYIPSELLPTFNIMTIEDYFCKIKELSNNYVYCNDDYFFLNETTADMFFKDNKPVYKDTQTEIKKLDTSGIDGTFYQILNNGMDMQLRISKNAHWYAFDHLPVSHKKNFELEILNKYYDDFINANNKNRFRDRNNLSNHVFLCLYKDTMPYIKYDNYKNSCYVTITKNTNFNDFKDKQMVCFNDTQRLEQKDFYEVKNRMITFLNNKFPDKSCFEKGGDNMVKLETIYEFTLGRFKELKNVVRKDINKNDEGRLYIGDTFECEEELANYLTGNNANKMVVAKVLEVIPEPKKEEVKVEIKEEPKVKETKKRGKKSKK